MGDLSKNFSRMEFACKGGSCCGHSAPVSESLVEGLQQLRDRLGKPIHITSGFRCVTHNDAVGGADMSQHMYGTAADIAVGGLSPQQLAKEAEQVKLFHEGGIGVYSSWVHVDVRKSPARWVG